MILEEGGMNVETCVYRVARKDDELYHWGVLGMKWGVRRYQNKDGSLTNAGKKHYDKETAKLKAEKKLLKNKARTQKKMDKLTDLKKEVDDLKKADEAAKAGESREEKRKRLLESTDAKEIYENRDLLTTAEINDRINRIDTEAKLKNKIPEQKTGLDVVNSKMNKASNTLNNVTNMFQKVDNAYSAVSKSAMGKTLMKKLGLEPPKKEFDINNFWENRSKKSAQEMQEAAKWASSAKIINEYVKSQSQTKSNNTGKNDTGASNNSSSNSNAFTGTVEGQGTSRYREAGNDYVDNNPTWRDVSTDSSDYSQSYSTGQNYVAGYLTYKR